MKYLIIFLIITSYCFAQEIELKGKVLNKSTNLPLPSANILVKGKSIGVASDEKGNFILKGQFSNNDTIVVSYIGFDKVESPFSQLFTDQTNNFYLESKIITSQTVLVKGSIAQAGITPISFSKLDRQDIGNSYTNQDIPDFLSYTPSATFYSENGNGLGYNYLSIRGFDQRRISVSINGVPQNDPEDHNVYWIDFPDLLGSTELIQVQRGSGSGITGFAAIGGSINLITSVFSDKPHKELSMQYGGYNTRKYSISVSSGLIDEKYSIYTKLSHTMSSGYRNLSWADLKSYHLSFIRYDDKLTTQINLFGGLIADGLAYTGLPKFVIEDKNLRKANYSYWEAGTNSYSYTLDRRPNEIENFSQPHFELLSEYNISDDVTLNSALFLVVGKGFFDYDGSWSVFYDDYFRLKENGFDSTMIPTNALIRAQVENTQWGWLPRISIKHNKGQLILGSELRLHNSIHWGSINYAENLPAGVTKDYKYYYYEGGNDIFNFYLHENYQLNNDVNLLGEVQLAYHNYKIKNEKYLGNKFTIDDLFLNPRIGINYRYSPELSFYASFARVTREPRLKNYYDAAESSDDKTFPQFGIDVYGYYDFTKPLVKPETMNDFEIGSAYVKENISASINLYYMLFNNEITKQGLVDRFGQPITGNIDMTIHLGVELTGNVKIFDNLEFIFNGMYSKNYISRGTTFIKYNKGQNILLLDISNNRISSFPDLLFNGVVRFNYKKFSANISLKYVGRYYSDNYAQNFQTYLRLYPGIVDEYDDGIDDYFDNVMPAYFTSDLYVGYEFDFNNDTNSIKMFTQIRNLFNNLYAAYATGKEFFPAAERNILFGLTVGL